MSEKFWGRDAYKQFILPVVLTALLTGLVGFFSNQQAHSNAMEAAKVAHAHALEEANVQFIRGQRLDVYSSFITAAEDLLRAQRNAKGFFIGRPSIQSNGQSRIDAVGDSNVKLQAAVAQIEMLKANAQAIAEARELVTRMEKTSKIFFDAYDNFGQLNDAAFAAIGRDADTEFTAYYQAKKRFLAAARADFPSS